MRSASCAACRPRRTAQLLAALDALAEFDARATAESEGSADGVNLLTYHRTKGLEWDVVFLEITRAER